MRWRAARHGAAQRRRVSLILVQRLTDLLCTWRGSPVRVLHNPHPRLGGGTWCGSVWAQPRAQDELAAQTPALNQAVVKEVQAPAAVKKIVPRVAAARRTRLLAAAARQERRCARHLPCCHAAPGRGRAHIVLSGRRFALKLGQAVRFNLLANSQSHAPVQAGQIVALTGDGLVETAAAIHCVASARRQGADPG